MGFSSTTLASLRRQYYSSPYFTLDAMQFCVILCDVIYYYVICNITGFSVILCHIV